MVALFAAQSNILEFPPTGIVQGKDEWYTPAKYVEAAREVFGGTIDLDPASCEVANQTVKAGRYYTKEDNGLTLPFYGNIYINPPYGKMNNKSTIDLWIRKLIQEYKARNVSQAILLTTCDSDNQWFQLLWDYVICFTNHNVHFFKPDASGRITKDSRSTQMFGTVFTYLGPNEQAFIDTFSQFGRIAKAIDTPRQAVTPSTLWEVQP